MKYTECRWHSISDNPVHNGEYVVALKGGRVDLSHFYKDRWMHAGIDHWSEIPESTDEELDEYAYRNAQLRWQISVKEAFLAGCKSARERMNK